GFGSAHAYRIRPDDYYLPELGLTEAELAALHVAVTAVRLEGEEGHDALRKLGGLAGEGADAALAEVSVTPKLARPFDAVPRRAAWVVEQLGADTVVEEQPDGSVVVELAVVNRPAFRSWVLDLLDHAEVLSPPELRTELVGWLDELGATAP